MTAIENLRFSAAAVAILFLLTLCGCQGVQQSSTTTTPPNSDINSINHIVFMAQENRSLDTYFGQLPAYWAANGFPSQQFDGMPANASNPAYNGTTIPGAASVSAFHM